MAQVALSDARARDIWRAFVGNLHTYVRRHVHPSNADDLAGEILLKLVESRLAVENATNPIAWMRRVATNTLIDHYRRAEVRRRAAMADDPTDPMHPMGDSGPEHDVTTALAACLRPMIMELPEPYAGALLMTDIEGLTQAEAARRVGISVSGMKSRVQRGRAKLKQALYRCCAIEADRRGNIVKYKRRSIGLDGDRHVAPNCVGCGGGDV